MAAVIHSIPRRQRVLLVFMVTALTLAPVALTLARPSTYLANVELVAMPHGRAAQVKLVSDVRAALRNPFVRLSIIQHAGVHDATPLVNRIEVARGSAQDKSSVVVRAPGAKPEQARQLADAVAFALVANSRGPSQFRAALNDRVTKIERTLRSSSLSPTCNPSKSSAIASTGTGSSASPNAA